jgi:hypothetical protein
LRVLEITYRPLKSLIPYARNTKKHPRSQISKLKASLVEFGYTRPIAVADNVIVFGHGVLAAALELADQKIPIPHNPDIWQAPTVDLSHLSDAQRRAYVIADNRLAEDATWDVEMLEVELPALQELGYDLTLTGFTVDELRGYVPGIEGSGEGLGPDTAELLQRMDITQPEPRHEVAPGDRYVLGNRHLLFCAGVMDQHREWAPSLIEDPESYFCGYSSPFTPFGTTSETKKLIMVQPNTYIAGHLLDRYADAHGEDSIVKI